MPVLGARARHPAATVSSAGCLARPPPRCSLSLPAAPPPCAPLQQANEILHHKLTLNGYLAEFTGQGMETITADTDRDFFMSAQEAVSSDAAARPVLWGGMNGSPERYEARADPHAAAAPPCRTAG